MTSIRCPSSRYAACLCWRNAYPISLLMPLLSWSQFMMHPFGQPGMGNGQMQPMLMSASGLPGPGQPPFGFYPMIPGPPGHMMPAHHLVPAGAPPPGVPPPPNQAMQPGTAAQQQLLLISLASRKGMDIFAICPGLVLVVLAVACLTKSSEGKQPVTQHM